MSRHILFWEYNVAHCPLDPKEKVQQWLGLAELVKSQLKSGVIKEWAHYAGDTAGYCIVEGNELDVLRLTDGYLPYVKWTTRTLMTIEQCESVWKSL